ncbi:MAG: hypothetical protein EP332_11865 [Bacteroidetes bacterium]|nr:MAG: hypothetical protein EP332_11865 [Bacteroidota bacterium]
MTEIETHRLIFLISLGVLGFFLPYIETSFRRRLDRKKEHRFLNSEKDKAMTEFLAGYSNFYKDLDENMQARFRWRMHAIQKQWKVIVSDELGEDPRLIYPLSAAAAQLTFGLDSFRFPYLKKIFLVKEHAYSKSRGFGDYIFLPSHRELKISMRALLGGEANDHDGYHPGLKAMTLILLEMAFEDETKDRLFDNYIEKVLSDLYTDYLHLSKEDQDFWGKDAISDERTFMAETVVHFFEMAAEMKTRFPAMFQELCLLLQLDPLNRKTNYKLSEHFDDESNRNEKTDRFPIVFRFMQKGSMESTSNALDLSVFLALIPFSLIAAKNGLFAPWLAKYCFYGGLIYGFSTQLLPLLIGHGRAWPKLILSIMHGAGLCMIFVFALHYLGPKQEVHIDRILDLNCRVYCPIPELEGLPKEMHQAKFFGLNDDNLRRKKDKGEQVVLHAHFDYDYLGMPVNFRCDYEYIKLDPPAENTPEQF